ncbi:hypothetical protein EAF00_003350 [Botryotinia globosa]|nr:hypothetical protein EAF00_003350 [Botryotinia globosa]
MLQSAIPADRHFFLMVQSSFLTDLVFVPLLTPAMQSSSKRALPRNTFDSPQQSSSVRERSYLSSFLGTSHFDSPQRSPSVKKKNHTLHPFLEPFLQPRLQASLFLQFSLPPLNRYFTYRKISPYSHDATSGKCFNLSPKQSSTKSPSGDPSFRSHFFFSALSSDFRSSVYSTAELSHHDDTSQSLDSFTRVLHHAHHLPFCKLQDDLEVRGAKCDDENNDRSLTLRLLAVDLLQFESSLIDSASINLILCKSAECVLFESSLQDTSPSPLTTSELSDALGHSTSALHSHCFFKHCIFPEFSNHVSTTVKGTILRSLLILGLLRGLNQVQLTVTESILMNLHQDINTINSTLKIDFKPNLIVSSLSMTATALEAKLPNYLSRQSSSTTLSFSCLDMEIAISDVFAPISVV